MGTTGLHPTEDQRRATIERTSKLRRRIFAWIDGQTKFFPGLAGVRELEAEARARAAATQPVPGVRVSDIALWTPSAIAAGPSAEDVMYKAEVCDHEYRLRVGQAHETLDEVCRMLLVRTHLCKLWDTHARGSGQTCVLPTRSPLSMTVSSGWPPAIEQRARRWWWWWGGC